MSYLEENNKMLDIDEKLNLSEINKPMKKIPALLEKTQFLFGMEKKLLVGFCLFFGLSGVAIAIPSPDLVINLFASLGQLLGMLSVAFGGAALSLKKKGKANGASCSPWPFRVAMILLLGTAVSFGMYATYKIDLDNKRLQTNLTRSSKENGRAVGDVSLKTLSFSEQLEHKRGISTDQMQSWLDEGKSLNIIDVREREETEAGMITGANSIGYPDLLKDHSNVTSGDEVAVMLCFSGNRSSELCNLLAKEGVDCRFMVGGYEKWLAEGKLVNSSDPKGSNLRALPYYPNQDILLETAEVQALVKDEGAVFVDVRYPGDFELGHLPNAVNIPLRKMTRAEAEPALKSLPIDKPIISPCYDKRSCFYGQIVGLRLSRLGYDFRGRYTVPLEYTQVKKKKAHVTAWENEQQGKTLLGMIGVPLKWMLFEVKTFTGNFFFAILFMVVGLRLLLLPFSIKMEIDRLKEALRAPEIKELKKRLAIHPHRLQRALRKIQKEDNPSPIFNLVGNMLQLLLFIVLFTVVGDAAQKFPSPLLWMDTISRPDFLMILPLLVSGIIFIHLTLGMVNATKSKIWMNRVFTLIIFVLCVNISAALNIYLLMSMAFLTLQGMVIRRVFHARNKVQEESHIPVVIDDNQYEGIVPLIALNENSGGGNKGLKLGEMLKAGLPVPDGFAVTRDVLAQDHLTSKDKKRIKSEWKRIKATKVAVRSSGLNEDGEDKSYAGVFESILEVPWENFYEALEEVQQSFSIDRAASYSGIEEVGGIVVQKMVDAEYAGVMFTEHPATSGSMLVELISGLGEALVSGQATPDPFQYGRYSGQELFDEKPPIDLAPLLVLGRKIEKHFGKPQDIEWAYAGGEFYMLQTRDITSHSRNAPGKAAMIERERRRLLELFAQDKNEVKILKQNDLSELMPTPTRLSLSMMNKIWDVGGAVDLACAQLGIPYEVDEDSPPYVISSFGSMYVNSVEESKRLGKGPSMVGAFKLSRAAESIEKGFRNDFLPVYSEEVMLRESIDFKRFDVNKLIQIFHEWSHEFITDIYLQAELINVSAEYYMHTARMELERRNCNAAEYLGHVPQTVVNKAMALLPKIHKKQATIQEFLDLFGHRAPQDFELSMPRYSESLGKVAHMAEIAQEVAHKDKVKETVIGNAVLELAIKRARNFQTLKEEAKHHCLRHFTLLRSVLLEIDKKLDMQGGIFELDIDEVYALENVSFMNEALGLVESRRVEKPTPRELLPLDFTLKELEVYDLGLNIQGAGIEADGELSGLRISGSGEGIGRVRVMSTSEELILFERGEVLVARFTDPTWTPAFSLASGVVTEVGGWLSHAAILARELDVVGIVGAPNATRKLGTGDLVKLHDDGRIEVLQANQRECMRYPVEERVKFSVGGKPTSAELINISLTGCQLRVGATVSIKVGKKGVIRLVNSKKPVIFKTIRQKKREIGIEFLEKIPMSIIGELRGTTLEEEERSTQEAKHRLLKATLNVSSEEKVSGVLKAILSSTTSLMQADRSSLFLYDEEKDELHTVLAEGLEGDDIRIPQFKGIAGSAFKSGQQINIHDAYNDKRFNDEIDKETNYKTETLLCCPVIHDDNKLGVIQVLNKIDGLFTKEDELLLTQYAEQAAIALINARKRDTLKK